MNSTVCAHAPCSAAAPRTPFYHTDRAELVPGLSDPWLALAAPVLAYWALSLAFHALDVSGWRWLDRYRLHESAEVRARNLVGRGAVVRAVVLQQVIQTALGWWWIEERPQLTGAEHARAAAALAPTLRMWAGRLLGEKAGRSLLSHQEGDLAYFVYWWGIPILQFLFAMFIIDTWQYFLHRAMHVNKWMYRHFHSVHHRLYVPYAFGALYNHPVEGFLLDTLGAVAAEALAGMSVRQATFLFAFSTFKTVDDHCGYRLPWDPLQWFSANDADYHDIHHQIVGIKSNFSQPFFIHWDVILGTRMTRADIEARRQKVRDKTD